MFLIAKGFHQKKTFTTMQVVTNVITGLCILYYRGFSSALSQARNGGDSHASDDLLNESDLYFETTQSPARSDVKQDPSISFKNDFLEPLPLISDPLFEDVILNTSSAKVPNRKRDIPVRGFTHENKMMLLQLHNLYRSNVTPSAGDMSYMEWDDELARLAQIWSDACVYEHGMPENDYPTNIGQNLYIGTDPTGYLGLYLWFEEYQYYDLRKDYCIPGKQCGHYVQMAYAPSMKLGCGMNKCGMRYLVTCHYSPPALKGIPMYRVAKPCSQCPSRKGSLCLKNLCLTREQCKNNPFDCKFATCDLECLNCGRLDKEKCLCECSDGWDSPDCSHLCKDNNVRCGKSPGFPNKNTCAMHGGAVAESLCRKMCEMCRAVNTSVSNDTCCDGKLCDEGYVLDTQTKSCKCKLLCPGPQCDDKEEVEYQAALKSDADSLLPHSTRWIVAFLLNQIILWKIR